MPVNQPSISSNGNDSGIVRSWCERNGYPYAGEKDGDVHIVTVHSSEQRYMYIAETGSVSDEIYQLEVETGPHANLLTVHYFGKRALRYALNAIGRRFDRGKWDNGAEYDYPLFPIRGIIEGFYGRPWSREQRLDMLAFIASHNMNTYLYGPKDDAYHRQRWRDPYDEESLALLNEVFSNASSYGLEFYYCIAPGLSMRYSSDEDFTALLDKVRQIFELGVRRFGLLLDDIPESLQHPEDISFFPDLVSAHIQLVTRFYEELRQWDTDIGLAVCPTQYCGKGNEFYISQLGSSIHPNIDLFWTGRNICSQEITLMEAAQFTQSTFRKPLYWDNYPVNDMEMTDEIHIGPYGQRDRHLYRFSRGIIANGMEYAESSKIAFATIASYLWNPHRYDPESCWREAIKEAAGDRDAPHMLVFADNVRYSCLYPSDSPQLAEELTRFEFDCFYGKRKEAIERLGRFATAMNDSASALQVRTVNNLSLQRELLPWIGKFAAGSKLLADCVDYMRTTQASTLELIRINYEEYRKDTAYVFADVLTTFLSKVLDQYFEVSNNETI